MAGRVFTAEETRRAGEARKAARAAAAGAFDEPHPDDEEANLALAKAAGITLPQRHLACTTGNMRRWLAKLGKSPAWHARWCGFTLLADWRKHNLRCSMRTLVGFWLEEIEREK